MAAAAKPNSRPAGRDWAGCRWSPYRDSSVARSPFRRQRPLSATRPQIPSGLHAYRSSLGFAKAYTTMGDAHILLGERDKSTASAPLAHTRCERVASALLRGRQRYAGEMM